MKKFISLLIVSIIGFSSVFATVEARSYRTKSSDVYVKGYIKKNGTDVAPHYRSRADGKKYNNYSYIDR